MRLWLAVCVVTLGCGGGGGGNGGGNVEPRLRGSLDLTGVIGFAIASQPSMRLAAPPALDAGTCNQSTLFALQADGDMVVTTVTEVPAMGGDAGAMCNTSMQTEEATGVFDTPLYDVITYAGSGITDCQPGQGSNGSNGPCNTCRFVVLRKSDGALFCSGIVEIGNFSKVAGTHDKLYLGVPGGLSRLDMSGSSPTFTTVDDPKTTMDNINRLDVDDADDALTGGNFGVRVFKSNGGIVNVDANQERFQWVDPAGNFFYSRDALGPPARFQTHALAGGSYTSTLVGDFAQGNPANFAMATATQAYEYTSAAAGETEIVDLLPSTAGGVCTNISGPLIACANDAICMGACVGSSAKTCSGGPNNGQACLTDNECSFTCALGGARHVLTGIPMVRGALGTGDQMYVLGADAAGNGSILGVHPSAISESACQLSNPTCPNTNGNCCSSPITPDVLVAPGDYSISAISMSRSGELTFAGLRNADGAHIIGNCTSAACSVLSATAPTVTTLQRIN